MSADNYLINDQNEVYFLTFTVADWIDAHQTTGNLNNDGYECCELQTRKQLTPRYKRGAGGEVNGVKFSDYYYNKLWNTGRGGSSLVDNEILKGATSSSPDLIKPGFFKYVFGGWEMVYNPVTKEVWHIQPIK